MAIALPTIIAEVAKAKNKNEKKAVLLKHGNNGTLKEVLRYTYDPKIKFLLPSGNPPYNSVVDASEIPTYL